LGLNALKVVGFVGTLVTRNNLPLLCAFPTDYATFDPSGLVDTLPTEPITVWNRVQRWLEAVGVIATVTSITQEELIFMISTLAQLTTCLEFNEGNKSPTFMSNRKY